MHPGTEQMKNLASNELTSTEQPMYYIVNIISFMKTTKLMHEITKIRKTKLDQRRTSTSSAKRIPVR